jgi:ribose/xylose/arabinose/galactoside ABC-type transport system permease subunit
MTEVNESFEAVAPQRPTRGGTIASLLARPALRPRALFDEYGLVLLLALLVVGISAAQPSFIAGQNLLNLLQQWAPTGLMAITGTFVIIAGGFDFSIGGIFALSAVIAAGLAEHTSVGVAFVAAIAAGLGAGIFNGLVVTKGRVNPFIATLGSGQVFSGAALVITGAAPFIIQRHSFAYLGTERIGSISISGVIFLVCLVAGAITLARTVYGRKIYAIGGSREASLLSGIKVDRLLVSAYALSGISAAVAGILVASRLGEGQASLGSGIEFDVVIAIFLGGTAISGGSGAIWRTAIGLGLLATMQNGFDSLQVNPFYQVVIKGGILLGAVMWDEYVRRQKSGTTARATPLTRLLRREQAPVDA